MAAWWALYISGLITAGMAVACVVLGYWMGRNSIERPMRSDYAPTAQQPTDDEVPADVFDAAMDEDEDQRVSTIR